ncbi:MAG: hypothetical protein U0W24_03680 [Bacteroidales bacterium]
MEKEDLKKHIDDLSEIRLMMQRASKFISLSGLTGILAGVFAIIGALIAYWYIYIFYPSAKEPFVFKFTTLENDAIFFLIILSSIVFVLSIFFGILLTTRNSRKKNLPLWDISSKKVVVNLAIPLFTGALFILYLIFKGNYFLVIPLSLIFYGLSLINAGHFTYSDIKYLGFIEIILGFFCVLFIDYSLFIWAIGFGFMHIIYGVLMYFKYER